MGQPTEHEAHELPTRDMADEIDRLADAADANAQEHELTFWEALRLYPKGVLWSIVMSTGVVMEGCQARRHALRPAGVSTGVWDPCQGQLVPDFGAMANGLEQRLRCWSAYRSPPRWLPE